MSRLAHVPAAARPIIALGAIGTVLFAVGRTSAAVIAWVAAPLLTQATALSPAFVRFVDQRFSPGVGRLVAFVLLTPIQLLVVLPVAAVSRLLGLDPVSRMAAEGRWHAGGSATGHRVHRSFSPERGFVRATGSSALRPALAVLLVGVAAGVYVPDLLDDADSEVPTALRSDRGFDSMTSPALDDAEWVPQASSEFFEAVAEGQTYTPYIGYSLRDYSGTHVNVRDRQRASYEPEGLGDDAPEVWFFGGSTMFGFSAQRDQHTIPSEVARIAEAEGTAIRVRNYGGPGYVNFQETVLLTQLLLAGGRPDVVVFYDGINDLAVQLHRTFAFGEQGELGDLFTAAARAELAGELTGTGQPATPLNPELPFADGASAIEGLARTMTQGIELSRVLADRYGFEVVHTWQPDLFSKATLDPGERAILEPLGFDDFRFDGLDRISDRARQRVTEKVVDLGDVFDDLEGPILTDQIHTNEAGARAVAEALSPLVQASLSPPERP